MATAKRKITKKEDNVVVTNPNEIEATEEKIEDTAEATETTAEPTEDVKPEESTEGEAEVTAEPNLVTESAKSTEQPNVRIKLVKDYHCCIAGTMHYFEKGKCYNVPKNIKLILNRAGVLAVL